MKPYIELNLPLVVAQKKTTRKIMSTPQVLYNKGRVENDPPPKVPWLLVAASVRCNKKPNDTLKVKEKL